MTAINCEARRLAKNTVRNVLRSVGLNPVSFEAKAITLAANRLIEIDPNYVEQAKINLATAKTNPRSA